MPSVSRVSGNMLSVIVCYLYKCPSKGRKFFLATSHPILSKLDQEMKPTVAVDEMFPEGAGSYIDLEEPGGSSGLLMDLAANEKSVHADFYNEFDDLYDDDDLE